MKEVLIPIIVGVVALALGILVGFVIRKKIGESKIGSAEAEAKMKAKVKEKSRRKMASVAGKVFDEKDLI